MKLRLKVKDPALLEELWGIWIEENEDDLEEIRESGGLTINEPNVQKGLYETSTGKGKYILEGDILTFEGFRSSFGQTKFFNITKEKDKLRLCTPRPAKWEEEIKREPETEVCILLEKLSFETSAPKKPFWAIDV